MLLTLTVLSALQMAPAADSITGSWQIRGDVMGAPLNEVCVIKQSGDTLTGNCTNEGGTSYELSGEVKDGKITFRHAGEYEGQALTIGYSGTVVSKEIKGTLNIQPFDVGGEFTATPVTAKP